MAVALFPQRHQGEDKWAHLFRVQRHMQRWASKSFSDPIRGNNVVILGALKSLHDKLRRFIDDYLVKETSKCRPWACQSSPIWSSPDAANEAPSPEPAVDRLDLAEVSSKVEYNLIKAFLRLELYSQILFSGQLQRLSNSALPGKPCVNVKCRYTHVIWTWIWLSECDQTPLSVHDEERLLRAFQYINSLYAALIAHAGHAQSIQRGDRMDTLPDIEWASNISGRLGVCQVANISAFAAGEYSSGAIGQLDRLLRSDLQTVRRVVAPNPASMHDALETKHHSSWCTSMSGLDRFDTDVNVLGALGETIDREVDMFAGNFDTLDRDVDMLDADADKCDIDVVMMDAGSNEKPNGLGLWQRVQG